MPGPTIVITQNSSVTTGVPNLNVVTGTSVTFSLTSSYASYQWVLVSAPVNSSLVPSSATLSGATNSATTITPDIRGTYKVRFIANNGVGLNLISELWFYARNLSDPAPFNQLIPTNSSALPRRHPAYTEGAETGTRGVATELDAWMYLIEQIQSGGALSQIVPITNGTTAATPNTIYAGDVTSGNIIVNVPVLTLGQKFSIIAAAGNYAVNSITINATAPQQFAQPPPNNTSSPISTFIIGGPSSSSGGGVLDSGTSLSWIFGGVGNTLLLFNGS